MTRLTSAVAALRAAGDGDAGELADATRLRLRRSLEGRAKAHRQLASVIAIVATLLVGGAVSWALSTVHIPFLSSRVEAPTAPERAREVPPHTERRGMEAPQPVVPAKPAPIVPAKPPAPIVPATPPVARPAAPVVPATLPVATPAPVVPATPPSAGQPPIVPSTPPSSAPSAPLAPATPPAQLAVVEALYRKAHELHFHGTDYVAALTAWDAYLAAEPTGRFVIEARFNRAIVLVRLGHVAAARSALLPFARGEVTPAGYRREEAERLIRRLGAATDTPSPPQ